MPIDTRNFFSSPHALLQENFDLIWFAVPETQPAAALENALAQHIDWNLSGQISRALLEGKTEQKVIFVPTLRRIASPMLALQRGTGLDVEALKKACSGLAAKRVLLVGYTSPGALPSGLPLQAGDLALTVAEYQSSENSEPEFKQV